VLPPDVTFYGQNAPNSTEEFTALPQIT